TVVADQHVAAVRRVPHDRVVIDVHAEIFEPGALPEMSAVGADFHVRVDRPDRVRLVRIDEDLEVVLRIAAAVPVVATEWPGGFGSRRPAAALLRHVPDALP